MSNAQHEVQPADETGFEQSAQIIQLNEFRADPGPSALETSPYRRPTYDIPGLAQWVIDSIRPDQPPISREALQQSYLDFLGSVALNPGEEDRSRLA